MAGQKFSKSAGKFRHVVSNVVNKKREELMQRPPSVQRELQLQFLDLVERAKSHVHGWSSKGETEADKWHADFTVGNRWREIQGEKLWEGLLDPIDDVLRAEIIRYGEFAQVTYDAFENRKDVVNCGNCRHEKSELFQKVDLDPGYEVTHYLYGTVQLDFPGYFRISEYCESWSKDSNWIGYVAVTTSEEEIKRLGRRDILIAWRGTIKLLEWIKDCQIAAVPTGFAGEGEGVVVQKGFLNVYRSSNPKCEYTNKSAQEQVRSAVKQLVEKYRHEKLSITITGHSLGSALATLCAYDLASEMNSPLDYRENLRSANDAERRIPITVYSFAGPRVGNREFGGRLKKLKVAVMRVVNKHDLVTKVPHVSIRHGLLEKVKNTASWAVHWLHHVGVKLNLDHYKSPYLETKMHISELKNFHNLEAYLHLVDGFQGSSYPFRDKLLRPFVLVNKRCNFLRESYKVPKNYSKASYMSYKSLKVSEKGICESTGVEVRHANGSGVRIENNVSVENGSGVRHHEQTIRQWDGSVPGERRGWGTTGDEWIISATPAGGGQWEGGAPAFESKGVEVRHPNGSGVRIENNVRAGNGNGDWIQNQWIEHWDATERPWIISTPSYSTAGQGPWAQGVIVGNSIETGRGHWS